MNLLVNVFILALAWTSVQCASQNRVFFLQKLSNGKTLLVVTWGDSESSLVKGCDIITDQDSITKVLKSADAEEDIVTISKNDMQLVLEECKEKNGRKSVSQNRVFFLQKLSNDKSLLVVTWGDSESSLVKGCDIITDQKLINEALKSADDEEEILTLSKHDMQLVLEECQELKNGPKRLHEGRQEAPSSNTAAEEASTTPGYDGIPVIFPGTKWCGAGDRAKNYDDLGLHQDTDRCCRAHDLCNDTLAPGETRNKLTNKTPFTKLSCQCDEDFYNCLERVNSVTSNTIGNTYFNVLKSQCYKEEYPESKKCKKYFTIFKVKCKEYARDTSKPKVYQWFPAKIYKQIPFPGPLTVTLPF